MDWKLIDWRVFATTYGAVFLAELGDKTQLATLSLASSSTSRLAVFLGSALALASTSAIAVLAGDLVARVVPPIWIKRGAGALFIVLGALFVLAREELPEPK
jgi:putative Ca2+/H+ antiporter (TMEM165/GDT1 family)